MLAWCRPFPFPTPLVFGTGIEVFQGQTELAIVNAGHGARQADLVKLAAQLLRLLRGQVLGRLRATQLGSQLFVGILQILLRAFGKRAATASFDEAPGGNAAPATSAARIKAAATVAVLLRRTNFLRR